MRLVSLPPETIIHVLACCTPTTIRRCQQVCRLLRDVVESDPHIQYILELDKCGYIEPLVPRTDLNYADKANLLREHRMRWLHPEHISPTVIELPINHARSPTYEYADGIYVRGFRHPHSASKLTRSLYFYQLPSLNKGTGFKDWTHDDLGLDVRDFGISPEQDLLVLLEIVSVELHPGATYFEENYKLHLRTMMTNEPHPAAPASLEGILEFKLHSQVHPDRSFGFQILGHLLALVFRSRERGFLSHVVIWDWTTGQQLTRIEIPGGSTGSFSFISEEFFVIPRNSKSYDTRLSIPDDSLGYLDIYHLPPNQGAAETPASRCIASFALPALTEDQLESKLHLRSTLIPSSASFTKHNSPPRLYDLSPRSQLLCIDIHTAPFIDFPFDTSCGTLHVSAHDLLDLLSRRYGASHIDLPGSLHVPWQVWANLASWVDTRRFRMNNERYMFGQRTVAFSAEPDLPGAGYNAISVLDFDQKRLRARGGDEGGGGGEGGGVVCMPGVAESLSPEDDAVLGNNRGQPFFEGDSAARRRYVKTIYSMSHNSHNRYNSIMMDDERVVAKLARQTVASHEVLSLAVF